MENIFASLALFTTSKSTQHYDLKSRLN